MALSVTPSLYYFHFPAPTLQLNIKSKFPNSAGYQFLQFAKPT